MERILIVDDDPDIRRLLSYNLKEAGFVPAVASSGQQARAALAAGEVPDLIVLDLMLPDGDGLDLCGELRRTPRFKRIPILMLTARSEEGDRVTGFEHGADDYVTKPFSPREIVLRVRSILRRSRELPPGDLQLGAIEIQPARRECLVGGTAVPLTLKEFDLLVELVKAGGNAVSRQHLMEVVWGYHSDVVSRTLDTHVRRLREKLGASGGIIETVRGVGYRVSVESPPGGHE